MLLRTLDLEPAVLDALAALSPPVRTLETLLERDVDALARDAGLAIDQVARARAAAAAKCVAFRVCDAAPKSGEAFGTGAPHVDALLRGGFRSGEIGEVEGPSGAGKTQVLLAVAARACAAGRGVCWVDCGSAAFAPARFRDLCPGGLERCRHADCNDAWGLLAALDAIEGADVIIVDAPARVLAGVVGGERNYLGHQLLSLAAHALRRLAADAAVIVANSTTRANRADGGGEPFGEKWKGALGETWTYVADRRLSLSSADAEGASRCAVTKAPGGSPAGTCRLRVSQGGLVSWEDR